MDVEKLKKTNLEKNNVFFQKTHKKPKDLYIIKKHIYIYPLNNHCLYTNATKFVRKTTLDMIFKEELVKARDFKNYGNYKQALELFEKLYNENPEGFNDAQKQDYAWTIIKVRMQNKNDLEELFKAAEFITDIIPQEDLNVKRNCPYTTSVFKVLIALKNDNDYVSMMPWLERLNPELLDERPHSSYGRVQKTRKESYYHYYSKAYFDSMDFERCIDISETALDVLIRFNDESDVWFKRRIAKSLMELNKFKEALPYFMEVIKHKNNWHIYRDIAKCLYIIGMKYDALEYLCPAVLSREPFEDKIELFNLCYDIFKSFNPEMALKHAQLYFILRKGKGYSIPYEIEMLGIDETQLDKRQLEKEIRNLWVQYKYRHQKRCNGLVIKFLEDKNFGFIKTDDGGEIFFHRNDFNGSTIFVGQGVSFNTEESFDRSKMRKSIKAVVVRGE